MSVVSPLHDIYYSSLYDTRMMPTVTTNTYINIQIESMIVVSDLNDILVSELVEYHLPTG
jgi:hypothetical protein